ncbi:MAG: hypothetical protein JWM74_3184 [Myxococcaceae bacterium]|nr:hypothetical protein [Myxococcaceae bacterium]
MDSAAKILELERRLAARERDLAQLLAGPGVVEPVTKRPLPAGCLVRVVAFILIAIVLVGVLSSVDDHCVADAIPAWGHHLVALGVFTVFATILALGTKRSWHGMPVFWLLVPVFFAGGIGADLPSQLNRVLDRTPRVMSTTRVETSWSASRRRSELRLASWRHPGCTMVLVPRTRRGRWRAGEEVNVVRGRGFFGFEWVETIVPTHPIDPTATWEDE